MTVWYLFVCIGLFITFKYFMDSVHKSLNYCLTIASVTICVPVDVAILNDRKIYK